MTLFTEKPGRTHNPLGGREADGFDQWLRVTEQTAREGMPASQTLGTTGRYMATSAARDYANVLRDWRDVQAGRSAHVRDELTRDHFEVGLISQVMSAYGAAEYARARGYGPDDTTAGGRPVADIGAEYLRACVILAKYIGLGDVTVLECRGDQDALMALRNAREG